MFRQPWSQYFEIYSILILISFATSKTECDTYYQETSEKSQKMDKSLAQYPTSLSPNKKFVFGGQKLRKSGYQSFSILLKFDFFPLFQSIAQYCSNQKKFSRFRIQNNR